MTSRCHLGVLPSHGYPCITQYIIAPFYLYSMLCVNCRVLDFSFFSGYERVGKIAYYVIVLDSMGQYNVLVLGFSPESTEGTSHPPQISATALLIHYRGRREFFPDHLSKTGCLLLLI